MIINIGDRVDVLDNTSTRLFRPALVLETYEDSPICKVQMLDCNDIVMYPLSKVKKDKTWI